MNRRALLSRCAVIVAAYLVDHSPSLAILSNARAADLATARTRLSLTEAASYLKDPAAAIQKRFELYKQLGFGTLRTGFGWRNFETSEGRWHEPPYLKSYLEQAVDNGFRLRLIAGALSGPPQWFLDAHPDAKIRDAAGEFSKDDLSLWYPELRTVLAETTDRLFGYLARLDIFKAVDGIFVDLGPASEPIYPAAWTMGKSNCAQTTPWFYDEHAQADFRQSMEHKYASPAEANRTWKTDFPSWAHVRPPLPGEWPGAIWEDVLTWYRDSKRSFIRWQVGNYQRALVAQGRGVTTKLIIMVPGSHLLPQEWRQAVKSGRADCSMTIMTDSEFLMDLANETDCGLQYTGVENDREVRYLRQYTKDHEINQPFWGENAGSETIAQNPDHLADVVIRNRLYGFEYVRSSFLFGADNVSPNETFHKLGNACERLLRAFAG